jgi:hypothetical protein
MKYDYRIEMIALPPLNAQGNPMAPVTQLPARYTDWEIVNVTRAETIVQQPANHPNPPEKRDVLIYTLWKPK